MTKADPTAPAAPAPAAPAPAAAPGINLQPLIEQVFAEIQAAEQDVNAKSADFQTAREKLAAARGKLEMLGQLQQLSANHIGGNDATQS